MNGRPGPEGKAGSPASGSRDSGEPSGKDLVGPGAGRGGVPRAVVVGIGLAIALDTLIQVSWKLGVAGIPDDVPAWDTLRAAISHPWFMVAMLAFGAQLWNWTRVLAAADLSYAQPFTALSYLTVLALSVRSLHEPVTALRMGGVGMILLGVFLISRTPSATAGAGAPQPAAPSRPVERRA